MSPPPFHIAAHVERHGAALRVLAIELVGDAATADDVVQETWLGALKSPPRHDAAISGWLATMLRNVARGFRRHERRRVRREQVVAAVRGEASEDPAGAFVRGDVVRELVAAVEALEPPYRDAIWQRFFEGKAPRDIAAATAVPVETVKSRLKRALGTLRERLGERDGADWRGALVAAFGLREQTAAGVAAGAVVTGGVLMATWMKVTAAVAAFALAATLWWANEPQPARVEQVRANDAGPVASTSSEATRTAATAAPAAPAPERREAAPVAPPSGPVLDPKLATIRGRCVDEQGQPLAGITFRVSARPDSAKSEQWELDHGAKPVWQAPPETTTGADGVFTAAFSVGSIFRFAMDLRGGDLVPMGGDWPSIQEGARIDVGDVTMRTGVWLRGRVVDAQGNGIGDASIEAYAPGEVPMLRAPRPDEKLSESRAYAQPTDRDGRFAFSQPLRAGPFDVTAGNALGKAAAVHVDLRAGAPNDVELAWRAYDLGSAITFRVIDESGSAVRNVMVCRTAPQPMMVMPSEVDGRYVLRRLEGYPAEGLSLMVAKIGYEVARTNGTLAWGTHDVELRMQKGAPLDVCVVDEHEQPVRDFTVRVLPRGENPNGRSSTGRDVRARGPFADGVARVDAVASGQWHVLVEFPAAAGLLPHVLAIDMLAGAAQRVRMQVTPPAHRLLRVVSTTGAPIAGTNVQLCDPVHGPLVPDMYVMPVANTLFNGHGAILIDEGRTDERGELPLRAPADRALTLLISGPGHPVVRRPDVSFATRDDLVVEVDIGGRVEGRIEPVDVLAELRRQATNGNATAATPKHIVTIGLVALPDGRTRLPEARAMVNPGDAYAIDDAGRFALSGVPAGRWNVELHYRVPGLLMFGVQRVTLGAIDVRSEQTTTFVGDANVLLPGTLRGRVLANGAPLPHTPVLVESTYIGDAAGFPYQRPLTTDAEGRFEVHDRAGTYRVRTAWGAPGAIAWYAIESAIVVAGQTAEQTFAFFGGKVAVTVRDAQDQSVAAVTVRFVAVDGNAAPTATPPYAALTTAADGTCAADLPAGSYRVRTVPRRYQSPEALFAAARAAGSMDVVETLWLELGSATVSAGQTTRLELRLPPEFDK